MVLPVNRPCKNSNQERNPASGKCRKKCPPGSIRGAQNRCLSARPVPPRLRSRSRSHSRSHSVRYEKGPVKRNAFGRVILQQPGAAIHVKSRSRSRSKHRSRARHTLRNHSRSRARTPGSDSDQQCMAKYEKLRAKVMKVAAVMAELVDEVNGVAGITGVSRSRSRSRARSRARSISVSNAGSLTDEQVNDVLDKYHMSMISAENLGQEEFSRITAGIVRLQKTVVKYLVKTGFSKQDITDMLKITPAQRTQLEELLESLVAKAMQPLLKTHMAIAEFGESAGRVEAAKKAQEKLDEQLNELGIMRPDMSSRDFDKVIQNLI